MDALSTFFDPSRIAATMRNAESTPDADQDDEQCPQCLEHPFVCECDE